MGTSETTECLVEWGRCAARLGTSDFERKHRCGPKYRKDHEGLHTCAYCGVVYLKKREGISFSSLTPDSLLRFTPKRDDEVARWLKAWRDNFERGGTSDGWQVVDALLDDYREHADTGTPLDATIERGRM